MSEILIVAPSVLVMCMVAGVALAAAGVTGRLWTRRVAIIVATLNVVGAVSLLLLVV